MVVNLTAQARIHYGTGFNTQEHKKHIARYVLDGLQQIFNGTLVNEESRVQMCMNDSELKEETLAEGEVPAINTTRPSIVMFVVKWVNVFVCNTISTELNIADFMTKALQRLETATS